MSPPEVWGPAVWTLFHTLAEKVTDQAYPFVKAQLFGQIRRICGFLPCPECSTDATNFLAKININDLKTKVEFRNTFYLFHNWVNAKKRRPLFNYSNLATYNNYGIVPVINNFISKYNTKGNMKLLAESFQRKIILSEFKSWFTKTIMAFTPPQNIPSPISEVITDESISVYITEEVPVNEQVISEETVLVTEEIPVTEEVATEETVLVTEEVVTEEVVTEVVTEEVVTKELDTEEVVTEKVVTTEETHATEEVVTTEETHATEVVDTEETHATEEVVDTEETVATEEVIVTEETVATEEVVVTEETVSTEVVIQPKSKKGRKSKK